MKAVYVALIVAAAVVFGECCERHGAKCPDYTVVRRNEEFEERYYPSLVWASVTANGKSKSDVSKKLIRQLYDYLGGGNDKEMKLDMMVPVRTTKVVHGEHNNTYTMAVALTSEQSIDPPRPTNPMVTVTREPPTTYVARSFTGMAREDSSWDGQAEGLKLALDGEASVDTSYYYICVYDSPWRQENRLNEVWMKKTV